MSLTPEQIARGESLVKQVLAVADLQIEVAKSRMAMHARCCTRDAVAVLVVADMVCGLIATGAEPATLEQLDPLVAERSPEVALRLRQQPPAGCVYLVVAVGPAGRGALAMVTVSAATDTATPAPNAPGGAS